MKVLTAFLFALIITTIEATLGCRDNQSRAPLAVEEIIERNTNAMGGRVAIEAVQAVEISLQIRDPNFEVDGVLR
jgi:hypothetical protein